MTTARNSALRSVFAAALLAFAFTAQAQTTSGKTPAPSAPQSGYGMGPGMMGGGYGMGPGMMGGGYGMGPGMMGGGYGMGPGMMGGGYGMGPGMMMGQWHGPDPRLAPNLTDDQRKKITGIQEQLRRQHWDLMGKMHEEQARLFDAPSAGPREDAVLNRAYARMAEMHKQMFDSSLTARKQMYDVLTKEQREQMRRSGPWGY